MASPPLSPKPVFTSGPFIAASAGEALRAASPFVTAEAAQGLPDSDPGRSATPSIGNIVSWLQAVTYHSQSSSEEDWMALAQLANNPPQIEGGSLPDGLPALIAKVKEVAEAKKWSPDLPREAHTLLHALAPTPPPNLMRLDGDF